MFAKKYDELTDNLTGLEGYVENYTINYITVRFDSLDSHGSLFTLTLPHDEAKSRFVFKYQNQHFMNHPISPKALANVNIVFCSNH